MELITSPWKERFFEFAQSIRESALVASPYITAEPLDQLAEKVSHSRSIHIKILTKLDASSMAYGSLDINAVEKFCREFPHTVVSHLPGLHAKVYIADQHTAIVTSGNLTSSSLSGNLEYGIRLNDRASVLEIQRNMFDYERFGSELSLQQLTEFGDQSQRLRETYRSALKTTQDGVPEQFQSLFQETQDSIKELRGRSGESVTSIFKRTVLHVLQKGSMETEAIHDQIKALHPDLCDDSDERIINGVHFGKRWKHHVRNAQQSLKRKSQIELVDGKWRLKR